jgi:PAS domain S-box-containing protein
LVVFLLSIWFLALYAGNLLHQDLHERLAAQQFASASMLANEVNQDLQDRLQTLEKAATRISPALMSNAAALQSFLEDRPALEVQFNAGIFVTRTDGIAIADVPLAANRLGRNVSERDYMVAALKEGRTSIGAMVLGKSLHMPVFSMAAPIRNAQGQVIGALVGVTNVNEPSFLDKISRGDYSKTGYLLLVSSKTRQIVSASIPSRVMEVLQPGANPLTDRFIDGFEGTDTTTNPFGVEVLASGKGVAVANWHVVQARPMAEAFAPVLAMQQRLIGAALAVSLIACALIWWVTSSLLRRQLAPLQRASLELTRRSESAARLQPLEVSNADEIGELIGSFNHLMTTFWEREDASKHDTLRWKFAIEGANSGVWDWNIQTGEAMLSSRWKEMLGYTDDEIKDDATEWSSRVHPEDLPTAMQAIQEHMEGKTRAAVTEFRMRCKDGHYIWTLGRGMVVSHSADGKPLRLVGTQEDISGRKQEQSALVAAKALAESASRAKSDFLANMSHEIRTPMNGVIGMVDILQETALTLEQQRMLDTIHQSSMALLKILNDILDFSKIEAGKLTVENVPVHLREVAEGVAQLMGSLPGNTVAEMSLSVSRHLPDWVYGDSSRLRQVLLNLLGNAIKFAGGKAIGSGEVSLKVAPCVLADGANGMYFQVVDNGIGMSPEVVAKLFQPFTQADESTARKFGGTGLGLSISQRLVELMGGRITVRSTLGAGSEFTVELPVREAPPGRTLPPLPSLAGVNVLMVTRNPFGVDQRSAYFQAAGAQSSVVPDMATARAFLAQAPAAQPWVVLVDKAVSAATSTFGLPATATVVRELTRKSNDYPDDIILSVRPLLRHDLFHAIAQASGRLNVATRQHAGERRSHQRPTAPTVEQAAQTGCLILLAEDNATNRDVMQEQLRLLGYTCEVAEDGAVALQMWQRDPIRYALLLSDCHMPHLDGFGLTATIRQAEPQGTHLPIIAITANAMQGEAQRCRERGMDDYLSKPLRMQELAGVLDRWLPLPSGPAGSAPVAAVAAAATDADANTDADATADTNAAKEPPAWNPATLTELVGDNPGLHKRLLEAFLLNAEKQVAEITASAATRDTSTLAGVAHTLKSAARSVGALALGELCQSLESAGRAGDVIGCSELTGGLEAVFTVAVADINGHLCL